MGILSKIYLGLPQSPVELLVNGNFEDVAGDDFADWTETIPAFVELLDNGDLELVAGDDFDDWTETEIGTGTLEEEGVEVHGGAHSVKISGEDVDNHAYMIQIITTVVGKTYKMDVWTKGDYRILFGNPWPDLTFITGTVADWTKFTLYWEATEVTTYVMLSSKHAASSVGYFDDVSAGLVTGDIELTAVAHGGNDAVLITGAYDTNTQPYMLQEVVSDPLDYHKFSFWGRGDGVKGVAYEIYDVTNSAVILSGEGYIDAEYKEKSEYYYVPAGCVLLRVTFTGNGSSIVYVDDASVLEYGAITWVENTDALAVPSPTWGYGLSGKDPLRGVAETGTANLTFDNREGKYSPENASRVSGFEEGMPVKITTTLLREAWGQETDFEDGAL